MVLGLVAYRVPGRYDGHSSVGHCSKGYCGANQTGCLSANLSLARHLLANPGEAVLLPYPGSLSESAGTDRGANGGCPDTLRLLSLACG
jgi:hypothetical protein